MRTITIAGGGLAGLFLGIRLRQHGVPVSLFESGDYPRHRVCGEFISGAGQQLLTTLDPALLADATCNRTTGWFHHDRLLFAQKLPIPAIGLSRYQLDRRLADRFQELGGNLSTRTTIKSNGEPETVFATGRRRGNGNLIGLKLHGYNFPAEQDLSMYLGTSCYVGISRVENGAVNICGLFQLRRDLKPGKNAMMGAYLKANGLTDLAARLEEATIDPASITATAACDFSRQLVPENQLHLGDAFTSIPPFAGNGMSMAFEAAETAFPFLHRYVSGEMGWETTCRAVRRALSSRFRIRLAVARSLHPLLLRGGGKALSPLSSLLPFPLIFRLLR